MEDGEELRACGAVEGEELRAAVMRSTAEDNKDGVARRCEGGDEPTSEALGLGS
jgi:hypothetical protein